MGFTLRFTVENIRDHLPTTAQEAVLDQHPPFQVIFEPVIDHRAYTVLVGGIQYHAPTITQFVITIGKSINTGGVAPHVA
ncbi:hypothetical protein D3C76_1823820 [compost metagenome]